MNDKKGLFLEFYDNLEQTWITFKLLELLDMLALEKTWITFKLLEPLDTLAKRAARSAASLINALKVSKSKLKDAMA